MRNRFGVAIGLLLLCLPCRSAFAEGDAYLIGGLTLSNLGGDATLIGDAFAAALETDIGGTWSSEKKTRTGFDVGVGFGYAGTGPVGAAAEIHYASRGVKWNFLELSGSGVRIKGTMKLAYVEFPLLLRVIPRTTGQVHPVFMLGPVLGIRASSNFEAAGPGGSGSSDIASGMKSTYLAGLLGTGLKIRAGARSSLLVQARYQLGLTNLIDDPTFSIKTQDFALLAGYSVGL